MVSVSVIACLVCRGEWRLGRTVQVDPPKRFLKIQVLVQKGT